MKTKTKRRIGTSVALFSTILFVCTSWLCSRSLFWTDIADHRRATRTGGVYSRRIWSFWSGGGFIEIERGLDVPTASAAGRFEAADRQFGMGWHFAPKVEGNDGDAWETFRNSLTRFAFYRSTELNGGAYLTTSRILEIPYAVPAIALMVPPVIAIVRRRRRLNREQVLAVWVSR